jgi:hypothetical protein
MFGQQLLLVGEQKVMHFPKATLCAGRFCCLGRLLRMWMNARMRVMPEYET